MNDFSPELRRLLSLLLDGALTDADRIQLNDALRDNPAAQQRYREIMSLHALLYLDFSHGYQSLLPPLVGKQPPDLTGSRSGAVEELGEAGHRQGAPTTLATRSRAALGAFRRWGADASFPIAIAATMACIAAGVWWMTLDRTQPANEPVVVADGGVTDNAAPGLGGEGAAVGTVPSVAVLGQATGATWSSSGSIPGIGGALAAGQFELETGLIQLEFLSGAAVIIEGPADFELVSANRLICRRGKLRARVPAQAHGFRVETPGYAAVDLGTEFTVQVANNGQSDFHVLEGEVELWDLQSTSDSPTETLTTGRGARAALGGQLSEVSIDQPSMVSSKQLLEMSELAQQDRYAQWRRFSSELRTRPGVLLYYGFNEHDAWERELRNEGSDANESLTGAIVGCQWTKGRWTGKQALEFKRITDRVRLDVPGEFESLTYSAWVRIEGLERWLTSLMLTDGHDANEVHWQITEHGALLLGVNDSETNLHDYFSPTALGRSDLGRWVHLATVYDGSRKMVRHYLDGKQISSEQIKNPTPLRIGKAEIGNWNPVDRPEYRMRSLNGRIDEFVLFSVPLSGEQIREIYEAGKPGS